MKDGVQEPSFKSNVSEWLGPPDMRTKITFFAVPIGLAAARATVSIGRDGIQKIAADGRGRCDGRTCRRFNCGRAQKNEPLLSAPINPESIFHGRLSVTEQEINFVDRDPRQDLQSRCCARPASGFRQIGRRLCRARLGRFA